MDKKNLIALPILLGAIALAYVWAGVPESAPEGEESPAPVSQAPAQEESPAAAAQETVPPAPDNQIVLDTGGSAPAQVQTPPIPAKPAPAPAKAAPSAPAAPAPTTPAPAPAEAKPTHILRLYEFYTVPRCDSCIKLDKMTRATLGQYFAAEMQQGSVIYQEVNIDLSDNKAMVEKYQAFGSSFYFNDVVDGKESISADTKVWRLVNDEAAFKSYLRGKINNLLGK
jgi:hypothetical protein